MRAPRQRCQTEGSACALAVVIHAAMGMVDLGRDSGTARSGCTLRRGPSPRRVRVPARARARRSKTPTSRLSWPSSFPST
eukprot:3250728-Pyramimonas_sp.AAC.2